MRSAPALRLTAALALVAGLGLGCQSRLPDYAKPRAELQSGPISTAPGALIRYRILTRGDFQASEPPAAFAGHREKLGAATCGLILPDAQLAVRQLSTGSYEARPINVSFIAKMDRSCSWWNSEHESQPEAYVLEHEQIHFALFEIAARRLDSSSAEIAERAVGRGTTRDEAAQQAIGRMDRELVKAVERVVQRSTEFDEATSMSVRVDRQREWRLRVARELGEPDPYE